jgi:L-ascorbate metabolism protein UlaG (beta-lactamase superfamily)
MSVEYDGLSFEGLGHASVRIETDNGTTIYIDPWSEVLEGTPGDGDVVFVTHDDLDHYDPDAIEAVAAPGATVAAYEAIDVSELDFDVVKLPHEGVTTIGSIDAESIPSYNDPDGAHVDEDGDPFHAEGEVIGLLITVTETTIYFTSDTDFLAHQESVTADVFIPPIGGHYTMDRHEASAFARSVDPELVLPVHYDTFDPIETDVDAFLKEMADAGIRAETFGARV